MISEEYVYVGMTIEQSIHDSLYRPDVDINPLLVDFLAVQMTPIANDAWQEFAEEVFDAYQDPYFQDHKAPASWQNILTYSRKKTFMIWLHNLFLY